VSAPLRLILGSGDRGDALIETAVVLPVLLMVILGLLQFALYAHAQHVVAVAVQSGARLAAADGAGIQEGVSHTQAILDAGLGTSADNVAVQGRDGGDTVVVEAHAHLRLIIPWVADATLPLSARTVAYKERFRVGPVVPVRP
jgi:Flp pilus assembly protein TadG